MAQGPSSPGQDRKLNTLPSCEHQLLLQNLQHNLVLHGLSQNEKGSLARAPRQVNGCSHSLRQGTPESSFIETCPLISHDINQPLRENVGPRAIAGGFFLQVQQKQHP